MSFDPGSGMYEVKNILYSEKHFTIRIKAVPN